MPNLSPSALSAYVQALEALQAGTYDLELPSDQVQLETLNRAVQQLAQILQARQQVAQLHDRINRWTNAGLVLEQVLDNVFHDLKDLIPYDRLGVSVIDADGQQVRAIWARSSQPEITLKTGYSASLAGSSLATILETRQPRILNDLNAYLEAHPKSESTRLILAEGIRSSLTCPLMVNGMPVGFIFFSSTQPYTYADAHIETFERIANQLSVLVEHSRMQAELRAANQELRRLIELKNTFLGMAAHDLRHPIGYLQLAGNLILEELEAPSGLELSQFVINQQNQLRYMLSLLDDLLDLVTLESGELQIERSRVKVGEYLAEIVDHQAQLAILKDIDVQLIAVPAGSCSLDVHRVHQVLDNLISNAIKFSEAGGVVQVSAETYQNGWRFWVRDRGPGISAKDQERIFHDFVRLGTRTPRPEKGTGLGLSIARRVVAAHGGEIGVESQPGQGASFWFTIPGG
ncbi:MAG: HAMP domain-containing histidine kinase [Anaerolineales bacterium]|nr:HAMP domain-containing histidine kinase [Anaerolineales bacterium]